VALKFFVSDNDVIPAKAGIQYPLNMVAGFLVRVGVIALLKSEECET
jgi:hypothetical protein